MMFYILSVFFAIRFWKDPKIFYEQLLASNKSQKNFPS